jgi:tellurite resistance protein TerC
MQKPWWLWLLFLSTIFLLVIFDLGVLQKRQDKATPKQSLLISGAYILIGLLFSIVIWYFMGPNYAKEYLTGFIVEKVLALDNIFVISIIFSFFAIPSQYQHRVLFWGIIGALLARGILITVGAQLLSSFAWIHYLFGIFLILTGVKMLAMVDKKLDINNSIFFNFIKKHIKVTSKLHGDNFYVTVVDESTKQRQLYVTPLFLALLMIEFVDVIFALDSIPAIFSITDDPYVVYTSNIFALLGLRALYFALNDVVERFYYLKFSLAIILIFVGSKAFITKALGIEKFPPGIALLITISIILAGIFYSMIAANIQSKAKR